MKLLYITPYYKPAWYFGGPPRCIAEQAEILHSTYNWKVDVLTLNLNGSRKIFDSNNTVVSDENGINVNYLPFCRVPFYNYFFSKKLCSYQSEIKNYDAVHIHGLFNAFSSLGIRMANSAGVPYVITPHGMLDKWCLRKSAVAKFLHSYFVDRKFLKKAGVIHFTTEDEKQNSIYPENVRCKVIPYLINFNVRNNLHKALPENEQKIKAVFWGRINPKKGLMLFVEAVSKLSPEERQRFTLDVYGNDEENHLNEIQQLIKRYGLNHIIQYKGFLDPNEREEKISRYDVMILTSYQENLGITVLESLQQQIPVFISDRVNVADWIRKYNCGWVTEMEIYSMVNELKKLMKLTPSQIREAGKNSVQLFKEEMNIEQLTKEYRKMYEELIH